MGGVASDIEMADACAPSSSSSSSSGLSPPPTYSPDYEGLSQKAETDSSKETVKETVDSLNVRDDPESEAINPQLPGTDLPNMARRSARNSNKPKSASASPPKVAKRKQPTRVVSKKGPKWTTQKLLTDPKSPLASANLRAILCQPAAWDILTNEERAEIVNLFPADTHILDAGTDEARPDFDALRNNNNFRHDCATYADNISQGRHDPEWLEQAWGARERRRAGDFDDYVTQKFEDEWSCKLPEGFKPNRSGDVPGLAAPAEAGKVHVEQREENTNQTKGDIIDKVQVEGEAIKQVKETKAADTSGDANTAEETDSREAPGVALGSPLPEDISSAKIGKATTEISPEEQVPESSQVPLGGDSPDDSSPKAHHQNSNKQTETQKGKKRVNLRGNVNSEYIGNIPPTTYRDGTLGGKPQDGASPLTLVLDSLEQGAAPVLREFVSRAKIAKAKVILLSFATLKRPRGVDVVVRARGKNLKALRAEILSHYPKMDPTAAKGAPPSQKTVVLLDSLNELATAAPQILLSFLSSIIMPAVSLVAVYHTDVPLVLPRAVSEYEPHPLTVLSHLATSILRLSGLRQEIERQKARNRSLQEPEWGLGEGREGVLVGLKGDVKSEDYQGVVVEMEVRRRSGRAMAEKFVILPQKGQQASSSAASTAAAKGSRIFLLAEHPVFAAPEGSGEAEAGNGEDEEPESTFNLGLTEKQRRDREGIVLPYFDAQTDIGAGEGGRILYEMGREDDFDDEEDEI
ncbi:hypothetical protein CaCOL14_004145 [Colletotrichum acutatum]